MAALALGGNVVSMVNARKTAKDKLDHEVQMKALELDAKQKDEELREIRTDLQNCRSQHEASEADRDHLRHRIEEIDSDREALKDKLRELEIKVAKL